MKKKKLPKSKDPRRMRREFGIGDFLNDFVHADGGIRRAVKRVQHEDQLLMNFKPQPGAKLN
jgi:hypothetical protein